MAARLGLILVGACAAARPTVSGAGLYANVGALQAGAATVDGVVVRRAQALVTSAQVFEVAQLIEHCKGGAPQDDPDCALALLLHERFEVRDAAPTAPEPARDDGWSKLRRGAIVAGVVAVPLAYEAFECDLFKGCSAVFGTALALDAAFALIVALGGLN